MLFSVRLSVLRSTDACWCAKISYRPSNTTAIHHPKRPRSQRVFKWRLVHSMVDSYRLYLDRLRQDDIYCQTFLLLTTEVHTLIIFFLRKTIFFECFKSLLNLKNHAIGNLVHYIDDNAVGINVNTWTFVFGQIFHHYSKQWKIKIQKKIALALQYDFTSKQLRHGESVHLWFNLQCTGYSVIIRVTPCLLFNDGF